jgi:hypothetical protein
VVLDYYISACFCQKLEIENCKKILTQAPKKKYLRFQKLQIKNFKSKISNQKFKHLAMSSLNIKKRN